MDTSKYSSPEYWTQLIQLMLFNNIRYYLEKMGMSKKEFADKLGVSKGYVSQILNGDFDHKLSKLSELALACELVPKIEFVPMQFARQVVEECYFKPVEWNSYKNVFKESKFLRNEDISANSDIINNGNSLSLKTYNSVTDKITNLQDIWEPQDSISKNIA